MRSCRTRDGELDVVKERLWRFCLTALGGAVQACSPRPLQSLKGVVQCPIPISMPRLISTAWISSPTRRSCRTPTRTSSICASRAGREGAAPRCDGGDGIRRHARGVQGRRALLQLRGGRWSVPAAAVHAGGRRHQRPDRGAPHRDAAARAHGGDGPAATTPRRARCSAACSPRSGSKPTRTSCGSSPIVSSTSSSTPDAANSSPPTQSRSRCWQLPTCSGVPREDHAEFVDALANPHLMGNIEGEAAVDQPAGVPRREVQRLHRGAPRRTARRRAERTRHGDLSGRFVTRGVRGRAHRDLPVRCRAGDHGQATRCRVAHPVRPPGTPADAARRPEPRSGLHRGDPAHWRVRSRPSSGWRGARPRWRGSTFRRAPS